MIDVRGVRKEFADIEAVKEVSLHVARGSIYGLLGSNGAGKTTLLKMLAGIYKQDRGDILIAGEPVFENTNVKQRLLFLPDALYFFPQATIRQMAQFYRDLYPSWSEERFTRLQEAFPLALDKKIHRMSKGMQRQAAFWLAFSAKPEVMILDEPLDGLDAVMRQKVKNLLVQEVAERQMTVIISSHNLREVEDLCDHIGILHQGEIVLEKEMDELKTDVHKIQVAFRGGVPTSFLTGLDVVYQEQRGSVLLCIVRGQKEKVATYIHQFEPVIFDVLPLTLEEIFVYEMGGVGYAIENILV